MKLYKNFAVIGAAATSMAIAAQAHAEDLLGNTTATAFGNLKDTQTGMAPGLLGLVGFGVVVSLAIRWIRKAG